MDTQNLFEQILNAGQQMLDRGLEITEAKLNISEVGDERDAMLFGIGEGALITGGLAALLGTNAGRRLTSGTLKLGGLAAMGGLAYQTYRNWQQENTAQGINASSNSPVLSDDAMDRSRLLVRAMVAAAKADGQMDAKERLNITMKICALGLDDNSATFIACELMKPVNVKEIVAEVDTTEAAVEIYLVSRAIIDVENDRERSYLNALENALGLPSELVAELDKNIDINLNEKAA